MILYGCVAILIDADNISLSYLPQVIKLSEYYGIVNICRAYGDWKLPPLSSKYEEISPSVERVQVNRVGKNATDHRMLVEIGQIIAPDNFNYHISVFVIVSGDGDLASVCDFIQEEKRKVIIIGSKKSMSKALPKTCNESFYVEDLEDELKAREQHHPVPPSHVREFRDVLWRVCVNLYKTHDDWITLREFETKLREFEPDYEKKFGKYPLHQLLNNFDRYVEFDDKRIRRNPKSIRHFLLVMAYKEIQRQFNAVSLPCFGKMLRELSIDYEKYFGNRKLSAWLKDYPDTFKISEDSVTILRDDIPDYIGNAKDIIKFP